MASPSRARSQRDEATDLTDDDDDPQTGRRFGPILLLLAIAVAAGGFLLFFFLEHDPMRGALDSTRADLAAERGTHRADRARLATLQRERDRLARRLEERTTSEAALRRERDELRAGNEQARAAIAALAEAQTAMRERLAAELASGEAELREDADGGFAVALDERILFPPGEAALNERGLEVLARIAASLRDLGDRRVVVEGHTDSLPIASERAERFPTNWELSTTRATTVVRFLEEHGIGGDRLSAVGYAQHHPVASNDTAAGRRRNRRIELRLVRETVIDQR